jgi:hypothetical protein
MDTREMRSSSLSPSIGQHSQRLNAQGSQRQITTIPHDNSPLRNFVQTNANRAPQSRGDFKLFGDLKPVDSPRGGNLGTSSAHTVEINAAEVKSEGGSLQRSASPLGMPYFHELKEIQKQINGAFPSFPMQRN